MVARVVGKDVLVRSAYRSDRDSRALGRVIRIEVERVDHTVLAGPDERICGAVDYWRRVERIPVAPVSAVGRTVVGIQSGSVDERIDIESECGIVTVVVRLTDIEQRITSRIERRRALQGRTDVYRIARHVSGLKVEEIDSKIMNSKSYHSPDSCQENKKFDIDTAKKQDYFALGATLFLLKLGSQMLDFKEYAEAGWSEDRVIDLLQRDIAHLESCPLIDSNLIDFICSLLAYIPEERPTFEEIYRNKWLNENTNEIELIYRGFFEEMEETKTMEELIKSDFLMEKKNILKKNNEKKEKLLKMKDSKNENILEQNDKKKILKKYNKHRKFKFVPMDKKNKN